MSSHKPTPQLSRPLMSTIEAAEILNLLPQTLRLWRMQGRGPSYVRFGPRTIRYRREDIEAWVHQQVNEAA